MNEQNFLAINQLPGKTWYWLKLNETHIRWQDETKPCVILAENAQPGQADDAQFGAIRTGAGEQLENAMAGLPVTTIAGAQSEPIRLRVAAAEGAHQSGGVVHVQADEGQSVTVVEQIVPTGEGATALQTKLYAKKNAKICLVQLLFEGAGHTLINDVGGLCEENADIELVQLIVGEDVAVDGARIDLVGDGSKFESTIGYLAAQDQKVDINLIVNHIGKKTNSVIEADGSLNDRAQKIFRGTIDFKNGSSGSKGQETEQVLLLGDDVVNKTIPLILCAEENVEGNHGATIGALDDDTLFYFASRGMDEKTAERVMTRAKLERICRRIPDAQSREETENLLKTVMNDGQDD